ncbi:MAG: hypothetical protein J0H68_02860 [Sphingobacteriia bacterium]|nr:hypothetical protein [Sphingobacteriia bacterium]
MLISNFRQNLEQQKVLVGKEINLTKLLQSSKNSIFIFNIPTKNFNHYSQELILKENKFIEKFGNLFNDFLDKVDKYTHLKLNEKCSLRPLIFKYLPTEIILLILELKKQKLSVTNENFLIVTCILMKFIHCLNNKKHIIKDTCENYRLNYNTSDFTDRKLTSFEVIL